MAEKEADLLVDEEDQATDAPELAIAQKKCALGTYVGAFFDELMRAGVRDVVVSPGSRSTPLSMVATRLMRDSDRRSTCTWISTSAVPPFLLWALPRQRGVPCALSAHRVRRWQTTILP